MKMDQKIRAIMKATGWKQKKLAEVFDVSQSTVARWLGGAEPEGHRRDAINERYSQLMSTESSDRPPIRGAEEILTTLRRIEGLSEKDVQVVLSVISNALNANKVGSEPADADDQLTSSISHHE
jgi:transcriptional regulator with XRE-family HTH domain